MQPRDGTTRRSSSAVLVVATLIAIVLSGCLQGFLEVPEQQRKAAAFAIISGTVTSAHESRLPLIVALLAPTDGRPVLVDHFVSEGPGPWFFAATAGSYWLAAFEDTNGDGTYDDEPALRIDRDHPITLGAGQRLDGVDLTIPRDGRFDIAGPQDLATLEAHDPVEQRRASLGALIKAGEIASLSDPRFDRANAELGLWRYYDFLLKVGAGVYFLDEFDPRKIPVLLVHGLGGTPRDFAALVEGIDRQRFQPWVFYYPTGSRLDAVGSVLTQTLVRLGWQHRFKEIVVVAHSMGGLVARYAVLQYHDLAGGRPIATFVTISSPFGGMESAAFAVENAPIVVHSWRDVAVGSPFLDSLFFEGTGAGATRRRLPRETAYHLLFGFRTSRNGSSDGVVPLASQLRSEAQEDARTIRGYDEDHRSILRSPAVSAQLREILAAVAE